MHKAIPNNPAPGALQERTLCAIAVVRTLAKGFAHRVRSCKAELFEVPISLPAPGTMRQSHEPAIPGWDHGRGHACEMAFN